MVDDGDNVSLPEEISIAASVPSMPDTSKATAIEQALADGFFDCLREEPERFHTFDDVPEAAVRYAVEYSIPLYDAVLRVARREEMAIAAEQARHEKLSHETMGSVADTPEYPDASGDDFTAALEASI